MCKEKVVKLTAEDTDFIGTLIVRDDGKRWKVREGEEWPEELRPPKGWGKELGLWLKIFGKKEVKS